MLAVFLDTETTGLDPLRHSPIDIAIKVIDTKTGNQVGEYQSIIQIPREQWDQRDLESIEVNGFTWEKILQGKDIEVVSSEIQLLFHNLKIERKTAFFICQNPSFDRGFFNHIVPVYMQESLNWPYHWLDLASMYWAVVNIIPEKMPKKLSLSKNAIGEHYHIPPENRPHLAINGVDHLIKCYRAVINTRPS